jgi:hypothetical protein
MGCCGQKDDPTTFDPEDDMGAVIPAALLGGAMEEQETVELFTRVPGMALRIGNYGEATNETPARVPASVAAELAADERLGREPLEAPDVPRVVEFHAKASDVYHDVAACKTGDNVQPENRRPGAGGRKRCEECEELAPSEAPARAAGRKRRGKDKE